MSRLLLTFAWVVLALSQAGDYNHATTSNLVNLTWMTPLGDGIYLRKLSLMGTENSYNSPSWDVLYMGQTLSVATQLRAGIRILDVHVRHYYNAFALHHEVVYLGVYLGDVLTMLTNWLATNPGEAIVLRIEPDSFMLPAGNTRSFEDTMAEYMLNFTNIIWAPANQNPTLGEVRGKVVILQAFTANGTYGLLESSFTVQADQYFATNWDLYSKWLDCKSLLGIAGAGGGSIISFWTGYGWSYRFFIASGQVTSGNGGSLLLTGLTTPLFNSKYPDFPRVNQFWGMASIAFLGVNILGSRYIVSQALKSVGWIIANFPGDQLIARVNAVNYLKYAICTAAQIAAGCTSCSPGPICLSCNTTIGYLYDAVNKVCIAAPGYYVAGAPPVLCNSTIFGCSLCNSATVCTQCNTTANYALDTTTNLCVAAVGYFLDANNIPVACNTTLRGCTACLSATECTQCDATLSFIIQGTVCVCDSAVFMVDAVTQPVCICMAGYYLSGGVCVPMPDCSLPASGCLSCASPPVCTDCDPTLFFTLDPTLGVCVCMTGYYFDGTNCTLCNATLIGCTNCTTPTISLACTPTFVLSLPNCGCTAGFYLDTTVPDCAACQMGCLICNALTTCVTCDLANNFVPLPDTSCTCNTGYYLNTTLAACETCSTMPGCLTCNTTGCVTCDATLNFTLNTTTYLCDCAVGSYIGSNGLCTLCTMTGCLDCSSKTVCRTCDTTLFFLNATTQVCDEICGDGFLFFLQCDDGNNIDGDGCSSTCTIETNYTCVGGDATFRSVCSYNQPILMTLVSSYKQTMVNQISLKFTLAPALKDLNSVDFSTVITTNITGVKSIVLTYDGSGSLAAVITYNTSIEAQPVSVTFTPPYSAAFYSTPVTTVDFSIDSWNNLGVFYFPPEIYDLQANLDTVLSVLGYVIMGATLLALPFGRVVPIEMVGVWQLTFLGLVTIKNLQPLMIPFKNLYPTDGINTLFDSAVPSSSLPSRFTAAGLGSSYIVNFNYSVVFVILPLVAAFILFIIQKAVKDKTVWIERMYRACCEWFLACLLIMEFYNIACLLIQFFYSPTTEDMYYAGAAVGGLILLSTIGMIVLYCLRKGQMGEFNSLFKIGRFAQKYQLYQFATRLVLIGLMISLSELVMLSYVMPAFPLANIVVLSVLKPYAKNYNTYRAIFNECCLLVILGLYSYYRIEVYSLNDVNIFALYLPLGIIALLVLVLAVNLFLVLKNFKESLSKIGEDKLRKDSETSITLEIEMMKQLRAKLGHDNSDDSKRGAARYRHIGPKIEDFGTPKLLRHQLLSDDPVAAEEEIKIRVATETTSKRVEVAKLESVKLTREEVVQVTNEFDMI